MKKHSIATIVSCLGTSRHQLIVIQDCILALNSNLHIVATSISLQWWGSTVVGSRAMFGHPNTTEMQVHLILEGLL
jgi:hypothetical protein